jgi:hypothetical protein
MSFQIISKLFLVLIFSLKTFNTMPINYRNSTNDKYLSLNVDSNQKSIYISISVFDITSTPSSRYKRTYHQYSRNNNTQEKSVKTRYSNSRIVLLFWSFLFGFLYTICMACVCYACIINRLKTSNNANESENHDRDSNKNFNIIIDHDKPPSYESLRLQSNG